MFEERVAELEALACELGLDFFPTSFEVVPQDIMTEIAAYGLPNALRMTIGTEDDNRRVVAALSQFMGWS